MDDECIADFLIECGESLASLDNDLVRLEANPGDMSLISSVFRTLHTVKGTSGFLGFSELGRVAHAGENVLGLMREGKLDPSEATITAILHCVDAIREILSTIEVAGAEGDRKYNSVIDELNAVLAGDGVKAGGEIQPVEDSDTLQALFDATPGPQPEDLLPPPAPVAVEPVKPLREVTESPREASASHTIRVGIDLLEGLMTTVSELVLSRNQLLQLLRGEKDSPFAAPLQRLSMITSELQESVMKTRMQPIGNAWSALPRIIRDLAHELDKKIELTMEGAETELDRQVLELIKDPLTHMVRNAADHGLEPPAARKAAGKAACGRIRLCAYHEGGHIVIQIGDDGRGLDPSKIGRKAIDNGLASESDLAGMSDANIYRFILRPGFSTAEKVTSISGRGVGMDVVRTNIERIGGTIDIESQLGHGSKFTIKIPLTLAIVPALIVGCARERFAIPQISVVELVRATQSGEHRIEQISDSKVLRLRDRLLPLIDLRVVLGLQSAGGEEGERLIIVTQVGSWYFGIVVDRVYDTEEIVVKPVSPLVKNLSVYSGNTILGDGSICMIIDPNGMIAHVGRIDIASSGLDDSDVPTAVEVAVDNSQRLLLVRAGDGLRKAIPLDQIARLEDIDVDAIKRSDDGRLLVPYRDGLMLLVPATSSTYVKPSGRQPVLVFPDSGADGRRGRPRQVGLMVDEIVDILEDAARIDIESDNPDIVGSAVISGEPTEILNAQSLLLREFANWPDSVDFAAAA